jgi:hypothetical protein
MPGKYDKILRENIETIIPFIIEHLLGIPFDATNVIKDKLQVTIERETDYLCLLVRSPDHEILHIEFQTESHKRMAARMLLYNAVIYERYELPVRQFVIYLGQSKKPNIPVQIKTPYLDFSYKLINIRDIPSALFLKADTPEGVILAVLGEFDHLPAKEIIQKILQRLQELTTDKNRLQKCVVHLRMFSQLRKLQIETIKQIDIMPLKIDIRKDPYFIKGLTEGKAEGIELERLEKSKLFVIRLLKNTDFDDEKIALLVDVTVDFVKNIRKQQSL